MTGETGAGKSILIDALSLALGERAEAGASVVRTGCERAEVTAEFDLPGDSPLIAWLQANDFDAEDTCLLRPRLCEWPARDTGSVARGGGISR